MNPRTFRHFALCLGSIVLLAMLSLADAGAQTGQRCFPETGFCIDDRIREFWEQNGGLPVFGFPITLQQEQIIEGQSFQAQWFERNRLELHPENPAPYNVLLGRLGDDRLRQQARDWQTFPKGQQTVDCLWFAETGHSVCNQQGSLGFRSYWEGHGLQDPALGQFQRSLALFGLPLSEPMMETNAAGATVLTQWFERARLEWHPGNPDEFKVLLGLLGQEIRTVSTPAPTPVPPSYDGEWRGTTSQGKLISFRVANAGITTMELEFDVTIGNCRRQGTLVSVRAGLPIKNGTFEIPFESSMGLTENVKGSFSSDAAAAGTVQFRDNDFINRCVGTSEVFTWNATKQ